MAKYYSDQNYDKPAHTIERVDYTRDELVYREQVIRDCDHANNQRQQRWIEFDEMDYETWYWKSKKANEAYIEPKRNKEEVKVVTGTTREKTNTLVATLLNYNLEADITAFDDRNVAQQELGSLMASMVRKSRELELPQYEEKRPLVYKELVGQGNCFVEEQWLEYSIPEKDVDELEWGENVDPRKIKWKERLNKRYMQCNASVLTGLDVFAGNMREFYLELQPFMVLRRRLSRAEAEAVYGGWERWKNVPSELTTTANTEDDDDYNDYQMIETEVDFVEEIRYFNKWKNEFMIMLNGVMMLPIKFPMSALLGVCEYPIAKGDAEPISRNFFYSRGLGAKTRMDQAMMDEMFRLMIVKTRKSYKPPLANTGQYNIGAEVYMPGTIIKGLDPEKLKPIGDTTGVTSSEFNMTQFVKQIIDGKTVSPIIEGQPAGKGTTAREIIEQKQQSMVKIGMPMLGVINLEKRLAWLRVYNILRNWTKPIDVRMEELKDGVVEQVDVYRKIDVEDEFEDGSTGRKVIEMTEEVPDPEQVMAEEDLHEYYTGEKIRKVYIDPKQLRQLKYRWQVNVTPTEKNTTMVKAAKFEEFAAKLFQMFLPLGKQPNIDYIAERMALLNEESPDKIWAQPQQQAGPGGGADPMAQLMQAAGGQMPQGGGQLTSQMLPNQEQPNLSLNTLINQ